MIPVLGLVLGFRVNKININNITNKSNDNIINNDDDDINVQQITNLTPKGWQGLPGIPNLSEKWSDEFTSFMLNELPDDDDANDLVIETIIGTEIYKHMKDSNDEIKKRIILCKWLYMQGYIYYSISFYSSYLILILLLLDFLTSQNFPITFPINDDDDDDNDD